MALGGSTGERAMDAEGTRGRWASSSRTCVLGGIGVGDKHLGNGSNAEAILPINQLPKLLGLDKQKATNNITINSNRPLSPSEIAKEAIKAQRRLSYGF